MKAKRFLLLAFVVLGCTLIVLIWTVNMTQQGAAAARPILVTAGLAGESTTATPSVPAFLTAEPQTQPSEIPTLSDILEDQ